MLGTIIWALILGAILGYVGKLILPGRQNIPAWATIGAGVVAALIGGIIANAIGVGWFLTLVIEVVLAVGAVYVAAAMLGRGNAGNLRSR